MKTMKTLKKAVKWYFEAVSKNYVTSSGMVIPYWN